MQVGDPKKAAVLGVVALVIVSAGVFQLIPKKPKPMAQALTPSDSSVAPAGSPQVTPPADVPKVLVSDPFSHPALAKKIEKDRAATEQAVAESEKPNPPRMAGNLPFNPASGTGISFQPDPDKNTGDSQEHIVEPAEKDKKTAKLTGIVTVGHSVALMTIGDASHRFPVGAHLTANAQLIGVGQDGVVIELTLQKLVPIKTRKQKASAKDTTKPTEPEKGKDDSNAKEVRPKVRFKTVTIKKQFALKVGETINL